MLSSDTFFISVLGMLGGGGKLFDVSNITTLIYWVIAVAQCVG